MVDPTAALADLRARSALDIPLPPRLAAALQPRSAGGGIANAGGALATPLDRPRSITGIAGGVDAEHEGSPTALPGGAAIGGGSGSEGSARAPPQPTATVSLGRFLDDAALATPLAFGGAGRGGGGDLSQPQPSVHTELDAACAAAAEAAASAMPGSAAAATIDAQGDTAMATGDVEPPALGAAAAEPAGLLGDSDVATAQPEAAAAAAADAGDGVKVDGREDSGVEVPTTWSKTAKRSPQKVSICTHAACLPDHHRPLQIPHATLQCRLDAQHSDAVLWFGGRATARVSVS
jgi:hypothetical protein